MMAGSVFLGRCALCLDDGAGRGSDACDAATFMCCHKRRGREVLGMELLWPGDASCCNFLLLMISAWRAVWGQQPRVADSIGPCSLAMAQRYLAQLLFLLLD